MMELAIAIQPSLFETDGSSTLQGSLVWLQSLLFGNLAIGLCVLAVAFVGLLALTGRLPLRRGASVILGCFVLLGAPVIAAGLMDTTQNASSAPQEIPVPRPPQPQRQDLPPANYDPYSGASLSRN